MILYHLFSTQQPEFKILDPLPKTHQWLLLYFEFNPNSFPLLSGPFLICPFLTSPPTTSRLCSHLCFSFCLESFPQHECGQFLLIIHISSDFTSPRSLPLPPYLKMLTPYPLYPTLYHPILSEIILGYLLSEFLSQKVSSSRVGILCFLLLAIYFITQRVFGKL